MDVWMYGCMYVCIIIQVRLSFLPLKLYFLIPLSTPCLWYAPFFLTVCHLTNPASPLPRPFSFSPLYYFPFYLLHFRHFITAIDRNCELIVFLLLLLHVYLHGVPTCNKKINKKEPYRLHTTLTVYGSDLASITDTVASLDTKQKVKHSVRKSIHNKAMLLWD